MSDMKPIILLCAAAMTLAAFPPERTHGRCICQRPDMREREEITGYAYRFRTNWQNLPDADRQQTIPSIYLLFSGGGIYEVLPFLASFLSCHLK